MIGRFSVFGGFEEGDDGSVEDLREAKRREGQDATKGGGARKERERELTSDIVVVPSKGSTWFHVLLEYLGSRHARVELRKSLKAGGSSGRRS